MILGKVLAFVFNLQLARFAFDTRKLLSGTNGIDERTALPLRYIQRRPVANAYKGKFYDHRTRTTISHNDSVYTGIDRRYVHRDCNEQ